MSGRMEGAGDLQCCVHFTLLGDCALPSLLFLHSYLVLNPGAGHDLLQVHELCLEAGQLMGQLAEDTCSLAGGLGIG